MSSNNRDKSEGNFLKTFVVLQILLIALCAWAFMNTQSLKASTKTSAQQLNEGQKLMDRLAQLKQSDENKPEDLPDAKITELIERTAVKSGIRSQAIRLISPQPPARIAQSSYGHKKTVVMLKGVTLDQITKLTYSLHNPASSKQAALENTSLRFTAPDDKDQGDKWDVEIVFSQTVAMPPVKSKNTNEI